MNTSSLPFLCPFSVSCLSLVYLFTVERSENGRRTVGEQTENRRRRDGEEIVFKGQHNGEKKGSGMFFKVLLPFFYSKYRMLLLIKGIFLA